MVKTGKDTKSQGMGGDDFPLTSFIALNCVWPTCGRTTAATVEHLEKISPHK